jgi:hypothetical protein
MKEMEWNDDFYAPKCMKGILSSCERMSFSVRYVCFHHAKDGLSHIKNGCFNKKNNMKCG